MSIYCPNCGSPQSRVKDSRPTESAIRRRRMCHSCGYHYTTYEVEATTIEGMMNEANRGNAALKAIAQAILDSDVAPVIQPQIRTEDAKLESRRIGRQLTDHLAKEKRVGSAIDSPVGPSGPFSGTLTSS